MKIRLWKGAHHQSLPALLRESWGHGDLMLFLPPLLTDFSFVSQLPEGDLECLGNWTAAQENEILSTAMSARRVYPLYHETPVLGLFTSGSVTGSPKLILYTKSNIEFSLNGVLAFFDERAINHVFCYPQPFHTFGLLLGYMLAQLKNWRFTLLEGKYNSHFHELWLENVGAGTLTLGTPTHFKDLIQFVSTEVTPPAHSYACIIGGAPVSPALWQSIKDQLHIANPSVGYGATEASPALTHLPPGQKPTSAGDIGFPLKGVDMVLRSGAGDAGGFEFSGPNVCLAIIQNEKIYFPKHITLKDELRKNPDGSFTFLGRSDFMLNRGGEKFLLEDIEAQLLENLQVDTLALAVPDSRLGENLGLILESTSPATRYQILEFLHQKYQIHFEGKLFLRMPHLPLNASGKKDRPAAQALWKKLFEKSEIS